MRISDWSSDVCSSDLTQVNAGVGEIAAAGTLPRNCKFASGIAADLRPIDNDLRVCRTHAKAHALCAAIGVVATRPNAARTDEPRDNEIAGTINCDGRRTHSKQIGLIEDRKSTRLNSSH